MPPTPFLRLVLHLCLATNAPPQPPRLVWYPTCTTCYRDFVRTPPYLYPSTELLARNEKYSRVINPAGASTTQKTVFDLTIATQKPTIQQEQEQVVAAPVNFVELEGAEAGLGHRGLGSLVYLGQRSPWTNKSVSCGSLDRQACHLWRRMPAILSSLV